MKSIGVLTLPLVDNYGGIIQAAALYGFLESKGYQVAFISNKNSRAWWKQVAVFFLSRLPLQNIKGFRYIHRKEKLHADFIASSMPRRTSLFRKHEDFARINEAENFDAIVVGSDQVWRWDYISHDYGKYFLGFFDGNKITKVAYAASFGKDHWQAPDKHENVGAMLADFHALSTRESSGVKICQEFGRPDCRHVLDPTLLAGADFYKQFIVQEHKLGAEKQCLSYVLDGNNSKTALICNVQSVLGEFSILNSLGLQSSLTVPQWLSAFYHADFVVTDSYHGMIFSILFNKNFIVLGNIDRGLSRFTSLLSLLGLEKRLIIDEEVDSGLAPGFISQDIDYVVVNEKLKVLRDASENFLLSAIASADTTGTRESL